jgi:hypothetical protein
MPADVAQSLQGERLLRCDGPHAPKTFKRRPASWSTLHRCNRGTIRRAGAAVCAAIGRRGRARDVLDRLIASCATDRRADTRDLAILLLAFASSGRRRSEVARLRVEHLRDESRRVSIRATRNRPRYHASQFSSGGPRRATSTRRAGCFWSALRARRCANGWSGSTSRRADLPGVRPLRSGGGRGAHAAVDQSDRSGAAPWRGWTRRRFRRMVCGQGIGPRRRSNGWGCDAAVPASLRSRATSYYNEAERAQGCKAGAQRKLSADNFLHPIAADNRRVEGQALHQPITM